MHAAVQPSHHTRHTQASHQEPSSNQHPTQQKRHASSLFSSCLSGPDPACARGPPPLPTPLGRCVPRVRPLVRPPPLDPRGCSAPTPRGPWVLARPRHASAASVPSLSSCQAPPPPPLVPWLLVPRWPMSLGRARCLASSRNIKETCKEMCLWLLGKSPPDMCQEAKSS